MKKPKYITKDNYLEFKPSEFIRSFISDIEVAERITERTGKRMNMLTYIENRDCLPCLGGMACMNLGINVDTDTLAYIVGILGDSIRTDSIIGAEIFLNKLYPNYKKIPKESICYLERVENELITGIATKKDLQKLKRRINRFANLIEKSGQ